VRILAAIFISHSSKVSGDARRFVEALPVEFATRNLERFLDEADLYPGDAWRPVIYRQLAACSGAVLVLDPNAMQSAWVLKEATILAWRRALRAYGGETMRVVVVLADGVTKQEVEKSFGALYLEELEFTTLGSECGDEAGRLAAKVAALFPEAAGPAEDPMQVWTRMVSGWLRHIDEIWLDMAATEVRAADDWRLPGGNEILAHALLQAEYEHVRRALLRLVSSGSTKTRYVVDAVAPVMVPADTALTLLEAMRRAPGERVVALNACWQDTAGLFVHRATYCDIEVQVVRTPTEATADLETSYRDVVRAMASKAGAPVPERFGPEHWSSVPVHLVVVLQRINVDGDGLPMTVLRPLIARLRRDFPECVVLLLSESTEGLDADIPRVLIANPPLDSAVERSRVHAVTSLRTMISSGGLG